MSGHTGDPDPPPSELDEEQRVEAFERHGVDVEKSVATIPDAWVRKN